MLNFNNSNSATWNTMKIIRCVDGVPSISDWHKFISLNINHFTLCSTVVCWFLSRCTLISREPSNFTLIRFPTISAGKQRSSRILSCTIVRVRLYQRKSIKTFIRSNSEKQQLILYTAIQDRITILLWNTGTSQYFTMEHFFHTHHLPMVLAP